MLTLSDVLAMSAVRSADPAVLAAGHLVDRPVRWVHTTELADIAPLLRGGDLVLTTGIALPDHDEALRGFVRSLVDSDAVGLMVELGRRWSSLPPALVGACDELGLPLVALRREVRFAAITQAVGERLVDEQLEELRESQRVHETFTELSIAEAGPDEILAAVERLAGAPVVLESAQHRVVDYRPGPGASTHFLDDWERRSRTVRSDERTFWDPSNGWLVTGLGRREREWGRLVIGATAEPAARLVTVAERGAAALAMHRLHDRTRDSRVRRAHHELVLGMLAGPPDAELVRRAELAGLPARPGHVVGLALRPAGDEPLSGQSAALDTLVMACTRGVQAIGLHALVAAFESDVRLLVTVPARQDPERAVDRLVEHVRTRVALVAAAGTRVPDLRSADRTLREAMQVMAAVAGRPGRDRGVNRLHDVHLRGLLVLLHDDDRLRAFAERELAPVERADARDGTDLMGVLRAVLEHWGSKAAAAAALGVSRPVLYDRLAKLERVLDASLTEAEVRTSLHAALLATDLQRSPTR
ncbi:PucR family transcriptional regulator ligand-binding domain-containing protein [Aeromicrobium sp. IC_218]|uniref:PucR family transcriptional regulator n=1 Tax=Aeromicrobium sp. IC_218 TaxID=2545468 RepID=UPI00103A3B43|nr:PucR family transcriptional regulator ligand-binding domain-containing protein [Aeromicrobium sp. IC_218]TCI98746.1 PucR family transcriptional regulator [Aeromicrobium sp. IC_218]